MAIRVFDNIDGVFPRPLPVNLSPEGTTPLPRGEQNQGGVSRVSGVPSSEVNLVELATDRANVTHGANSANQVFTDASGNAVESVRKALEALQRAIQTLGEADPKIISFNKAFDRPLKDLEASLNKLQSSVTLPPQTESKSSRDIVQLTREKILQHPTLAKAGQSHLQADDILELIS